MRVPSFVTVGAAVFAAQLVIAQQTPIAYVPTTGVTVSGSLSVENGRASIGNNGTITAGDSAATVELARGGDLKVCASTEVHLSRDTSVQGADSALMIALDRGALEASYVTGKYSDVLLTPDLRILISGPGQANLKIRVNKQGDTCVDNHGADAPYVTVTNQFEGGVYRVQPNQRVMFEHGSLQQVVDNEHEPCGCPAVTVAPPVAVAAVAPSGAPIPAKKAAEAANPFPLAQSEGLAPAPRLEPTEPVVPVGVVHAEVQAPIAYDAKATPNPVAPEAAGPAPAGKSPAPVAAAPSGSQPLPESAPLSESVPAAEPESRPTKQKHPHDLAHAIGSFFKRLFGR